MTMWRTHRLGDVCDVFDGPHATPPPATEGPYFLGISTLESGRLNLGVAERISESDYPRWTKRVVPRPGDVVFSYETRLGQAAAVPVGIRCCLGRRMGLLRPRDAVDPTFLLYAYLGPDFQETLAARTLLGSTVDRIPIADLPEFPIVLPAPAMQRAIGGLLRALDDKIDLNRRTCRTLEAMAQALFRSWFVDFDPVVAKSEGRAPFGMDAATAALFPDRLVEGEGGVRPAGWKTVPLDSIATFTNGLALQNFPAGVGLDLPVIKIAQMRADSPGGADRCSATLPAEYIVDDGDLLFSWSGSLLVTIWCGGRGALNQHLFKVTSAKYPKWFCWQWTLHHLPEFQEIAADKATTMGHIRRHHLTAAEALVPTEALLTAAESRIAPLLDLRIRLATQSRTLATLRDTLLPRLLSGEITLKQAESAVAAVV